MSRKHMHIASKYSGVVIMLLAFLVVPESKPWYCPVLLFDVGLIFFLMAKLEYSKNHR